MKTAFIHYAVEHFQYPQSDRIVCNRCALSPARCQKSTFQYPQSDRIVCNLGDRVNKRPHPVLSVSAIGSNCLQLTSSSPTCGGPTCFQYPQSDRIVCNPV